MALILLACGGSRPRYDFEPHSRTIISCDGSTILEVAIEVENATYLVTYEGKEKDDAQNAITFLGPKQIGYRSNFPGFEPDGVYRIHIGDGDVTGFMIIKTDSLGDIAKVDNQTPCE